MGSLEVEGATMSNLLARKLDQFTHLSAEERTMLDRAAAAQVRRFAAGEDIIAEGEAPREINLILSGWGCRYKQLEDGRRQVVSFFLPGDMCDLNVFILKEMDHSIGTITPVAIADLSREFFEEVSAGYPRVATPGYCAIRRFERVVPICWNVETI